jgi:hypothetical protein
MDQSPEDLFRAMLNITTPMAERIERMGILITGSAPMSNDEMWRVVALLDCSTLMDDIDVDWDAALAHQYGIPRIGGAKAYATAEEFIGDLDLVVIGREDYNEGFLQCSLSWVSVEYMSQEAFLEFLLTGKKPNYVAGDLRIEEHPGLSFLADIGFEWPSTDVHPNPEPSERTHNDWPEVSELRKRGYSVREGLPVSTRRQALARCVDELGLEKVANHIAAIARLNKMRRDDIMAGAITRWEDDLTWLKNRYYHHSPRRFLWPST